MNRKFFTLPLVLLFVAVLSVAGCGSSEPEFVETEESTVDEQAEADAYTKQMEGDMNRVRAESK